MTENQVRVDLDRVARSFARVIQKHNLELVDATMSLQQLAEIILRTGQVLHGENEELPWEGVFKRPFPFEDEEDR